MLGTRTASLLLSGVLSLAPMNAFADDAWLPDQAADVPTTAAATVFNGLDVAMAPDGTSAALWVQGTTPTKGTAQALVRLPGGATGRTPLSAPGQAKAGVSLAAGADGTLLATWIEDVTGFSLVRYALRPAGGQWTAARSLSGSGQSASSPRAVWAGDTAIVCWLRSNGTHTIVQCSEKPPGSQFFGAVSDLSAPGGSADFLALAATSGRGVLSWIRPNASSVRVLQAAEWRPGTGFTGLSDLFTVPVVTDKLFTPALALAPNGRATILWSYYSTSASRHTLFSAATDVTGGFGPRETVSAPLEDAGFHYGLAVSEADTAVAVWIAGGMFSSTTRPAAGSFSNSIQNRPVSTSAGNPAVRWTGPDRAIAVWRGRSGTDRTMQSARLEDTGQFGPVTDIAALGGQDYFTYGGSLAVDGQGNAVAGWGRTVDTDPGAGVVNAHAVHVAGFDGAAPRIGSVDVPASVPVGTVAAMSADIVDVWSPVTASWNFGDGSTANGLQVAHSYGAPGNQTVALTARDALGHESSVDRQLSVTAAPAGSPAPVGPAATRVLVTPKVKWRVKGRRTKAKRLTVVLPAGGTLSVSCSGKSCPFQRKAFKRTGAVKVAKMLGTLPAKTKVTLQVTAPGKIGWFYSAKLRVAKQPKVSTGCLAVGTTARVPCP